MNQVTITHLWALDDLNEEKHDALLSQILDFIRSAALEEFNRFQVHFAGYEGPHRTILEKAIKTRKSYNFNYQETKRKATENCVRENQSGFFFRKISQCYNRLWGSSMREKPSYVQGSVTQKVLIGQEQQKQSFFGENPTNYLGQSLKTEVSKRHWFAADQKQKND